MPAKRVILHAGLPKTGTTAVQTACHAAREQLAAFGVGYWSADENHSVPLALLFDNDGTNPAWIDRRGLKLSKGMGGPAAVRAHLRQAIAESPDTFLLSAEAASMFHADKLLALRALASEGGAAFIPLVYLREPRSYLTSTAQQRLKSGRSLAQHLENKADSPEHWIQQLRLAYGSELRVRAYRGAAFLTEFWAEVGLTPEQAAVIPAPRVNEGVSHEAALWLDAVNVLAEVEGAYTYSNRLRFMLAEQMPGPRFQLPPEVLDAFVESNRAALDELSALLGEDIRGLPSSVTPPPVVPAPSPAAAQVMYRLAKAAGDAREHRRDRKVAAKAVAPGG